MCPEAPYGQIYTKFVFGVAATDVITCDNFLAIGQG